MWCVVPQPYLQATLARSGDRLPPHVYEPGGTTPPSSTPAVLRPPISCFPPWGQEGLEVTTTTGPSYDSDRDNKANPYDMEGSSEEDDDDDEEEEEEVEQSADGVGVVEAAGHPPVSGSQIQRLEEELGTSCQVSLLQ